MIDTSVDDVGAVDSDVEARLFSPFEQANSSVIWRHPLTGPVLIVDDNPANRTAALRAVNNLGCTAELVAGGQEALEAISRTRFAAVLMSCQMPGIDGYQASERIRNCESQAHPKRRTPIIAMTASVMERDPSRCRAAGMDDYLTKPLRISDLAAALRRWTRPPEAIHARFASPAPASTRRPDRASGHSPIRPPKVPLRDENPTFPGWRSFAY